MLQWFRDCENDIGMAFVVDRKRPIPAQTTTHRMLTLSPCTCFELPTASAQPVHAARMFAPAANSPKLFLPEAQTSYIINGLASFNVHYLNTHFILSPVTSHSCKHAPRICPIQSLIPFFSCRCRRYCSQHRTRLS